MRRRASNVYRRPIFLARVGGAAFAIALISFLLLARAASRDAGQGAQRVAITDSAVLTSAQRRAAARLRSAEDALASARARRRASVLQRESIAPELRVRRDSLVEKVAELTRLLQRTDDAPLVASFRSLAASPALTGAPRVAPLLDSLNDLDRARSDFGSSDGADPIFVALSARVGAVGHEIEAAARERRSAMRRAIDSLTPHPVMGADIDTMPLAIARDSAAREEAGAAQRLASARSADSVVRARDENESPGMFGVGIATLILAAAVVAFVVAFGIALMLELRWPKISDVAEAELLSGARVLVTIGERGALPERQRRSADREVPPSIEQSSDAYRLLYGQLADAGFDLTVMAIAGDHPYVTVSVAANLAAIAARSGRPTLLVDADFRVQPVATMMAVSPIPGVADVLAQRLGWAAAISTVLVSRGRSIDVLPSGMLTGTLQAVAEEFSAELGRLTRRYETVVLSASTPEQGTATVAAGAAGEVVICLRRGRSTHVALRALMATLESSGARMRGIVLWDREDAVAPTGMWVSKKLELIG